MLRDAFVAGIVVLLVGVVLIPVSQLPKTEIRDRLVGKQTVQIPNGDRSFEISLELNTQYHLAIKGGLVAPHDPVRIEVFTPDNSSFHIEFPREDPKSDFQTLNHVVTTTLLSNLLTPAPTHVLKYPKLFHGKPLHIHTTTSFTWE